MRTPIDFLLTGIAVTNYGKNWQQLNNHEKNELGKHVVTRPKHGEFKCVKPQNGMFYGRYVEANEDLAASTVTRYMKDFATEYSKFGHEIGITISIPERTVKEECPVSTLSEWHQEIQQWASKHNGEALEVAKDTCCYLKSRVEKTSITEATSEKLRSEQKVLEKKVFIAIAAGREAFGKNGIIVDYLLGKAQDFKEKAQESKDRAQESKEKTQESKEENVRLAESRYRICEMYLKTVEKAQRLVASIERLNIDLKMNEYASLLGQLSELEQSVPDHKAIDDLPVVKNESDLNDPKIGERNIAETALFARFDEQVKELISQLPGDKERVIKGKELMLAALEPVHEKVKFRTQKVCEKLMNAQIEEERRKKRTIKTGITDILNQMAMRYEVEQKNVQKTDSRSPDYQYQSSISFDELPEHMQEELGKKVAALHKTEDNGTVYSFDDIGYGLRSVGGADELASSVQKNVGGAIDKINALAEAAGFESRIQPLKQTNRYLVSELIALNDRLAVWAKENPYLMDLNEYEEELSGLALRKSSDSESAQAVQRDIDTCLNKLISACVNGRGNPVTMLEYLNTKACGRKELVGTQAQSSRDYIANRTKELGHTVKHLQEIQKAKPDVITKLDGKAFVAIIAELTSLRDSCADQSQQRHGLVKALDSFRESVGSNNEFDRSYSQTLNTLMEAGLPAEESAGIIRDQLAEIPGIDTGGLLKGMAETLPLIPCTNPVNKEYVSLVRRCSTYINDLREAGKNIEQLEKAKEAINQFAAELIQQPDIVSTDESLKRMDKWIEDQAASGELFQASGSVLSQWTGFGWDYGKALKNTTANIRQLCKNFDDQLEEFDKPGSYGKFVPSKWVTDKSLTAELSQAFINRGRLSDQEESGAFSGNGLPASPSTSVAPPPLAPPPPPLPGQKAVANNKKTVEAAEKPGTATEKKPAAKAPTGVKLFDFNPAAVALTKTGRDTTGNLGGNNSEKKATLGLIDEIKNAGGEVKNIRRRRSRETIQPEVLRRKEQEARQRSLNRQLDCLESEVVRLEDLVKKGSDDKDVENVYKWGLDKAKTALKEFHKKNPNYEKGTLTNEQLELQENKNRGVDDALKNALKERAKVMLGSMGPESLSDESWSDKNDDW